MAVTVLDSTNLDAVIADANGEVEIVDQPEGEKAEAKAKPEEKEPGKESKTLTIDPDDVEGEDGLTPREKRELSAKMQKAIGKRTRQMREAEEFAAAQYAERKLAEDRAAALQKQLDSVKGKPAEPEAKAEKPKREDFATESEFLDASIQWGVDEGLRKKADADAKEVAARNQSAMEAAARDRIAKAIELVPDFAEVTGEADVDVPPAVAGYMQKSEMFAELGYYLAKNQDVAVSLSRLAPDEQLVKIGKIEATLKPFSEGSKPKENGIKPSAATEAKPASEITGTPPSKARNTAPVIQPLNTNGTIVEKDVADMNIREHISAWSRTKGVNLSLRKRH